MATIEWLMRDRDLRDKIAHMPGVMAAVTAKAEEGALEARANLAKHRKTGGMRIEVEVSKRGIDAYVVLVGQGAVAFEFGHTQSGKFAYLAPGQVAGAHVMGKTLLEWW